MLGIFQCNPDNEVGVVTESHELVQKFAKLLIEEFGVEPNKILIQELGERTSVMTYNSRIKKLFNAALERKLKTYKWKNEYSANYVAGLFDCIGGVDKQGVYLKNLSQSDGMLLENLQFHTFQKGLKSYFVNANTFIAFIKDYSLRF